MRVRSATQLCPTLCDPNDSSRPGSSLSVGFFRREYWSGLTFPPPGDLLDPEDEPVSPALAGRFFTTEPPGKPSYYNAACKSWINNQTLLSLDADLVCCLYNLKCLIDYFIALGFVYIIFFL